MTRAPARAHRSLALRVMARSWRRVTAWGAKTRRYPLDFNSVAATGLSQWSNSERSDQLRYLVTLVR